MSAAGWRKLTYALLLMLSSETFAQVKVQAGFLYDSIRIGEKTGFYLSAKYPSTAVVLFPDSSSSFGSFTYEGGKYFTTESADGVSKDSAIYHIKTFDIDALQRLELPVFLLNANDCTTYLSNVDSIRITRVSTIVPDTVSLAQLPLKIDTQYKNVDRPINIQMLLIVTGIISVVAGLVWMFFGPKITAYFATRRLQKQYSEFVSTFNRSIEQLQKEFSPEVTESAVYTWKKYMEGLDARPYTKLTTTETVRLYGDETLGQNLRLVDRAIYGHDSSGLPALERLRGIADARFKTKLREVMHGK